MKLLALLSLAGIIASPAAANTFFANNNLVDTNTANSLVADDAWLCNWNNDIWQSADCNSSNTAANNIVDCLFPIDATWVDELDWANNDAARAIDDLDAAADNTKSNCLWNSWSDEDFSVVSRVAPIGDWDVFAATNWLRSLDLDAVGA